MMRLVAHTAAISLITAAIFAIVVARNAVPHWRLAVASLTFLDIWMILLALSVRNAAILPRDQLVPMLAILELGATNLAWCWFAMTVRINFRLKPRHVSLGVET